MADLRGIIPKPAYAAFGTPKLRLRKYYLEKAADSIWAAWWSPILHGTEQVFTTHSESFWPDFIVGAY